MWRTVSEIPDGPVRRIDMHTLVLLQSGFSSGGAKARSPSDRPSHGSFGSEERVQQFSMVRAEELQCRGAVQATSTDGEARTFLSMLREHRSYGQLWTGAGAWKRPQLPSPLRGNVPGKCCNRNCLHRCTPCIAKCVLQVSDFPASAQALWHSRSTPGQPGECFVSCPGRKRSYRISVPVDEVEFSQDSIGERFTCGRELQTTIDDLRHGKADCSSAVLLNAVQTREGPSGQQRLPGATSDEDRSTNTIHLPASDVLCSPLLR